MASKKAPALNIIQSLSPGFCGNERYWTKVYRGQGEKDAGVGSVEFIGGEGFYKSLIGKKCNYAIRYFRADIFFFKQVSKL